MVGRWHEPPSWKGERKASQLKNRGTHLANESRTTRNSSPPRSATPAHTPSQIPNNHHHQINKLINKNSQKNSKFNIYAHIYIYIDWRVPFWGSERGGWGWGGGGRRSRGGHGHGGGHVLAWETACRRISAVCWSWLLRQLASLLHQPAAAAGGTY